MLVLAVVGVPAEVIAGDYALSFERLAERSAARQEPDQGPPLRDFLVRRGTTAEQTIVELLTRIDVAQVLRGAGLTDLQIERLRGRLLGAA